MTKIYIVTSGWYADYAIEGASLSKEKAEHYCNLYNRGEEPGLYGARVEEFDLDDWDEG